MFFNFSFRKEWFYSLIIKKLFPLLLRCFSDLGMDKNIFSFCKMK